MVILYRNFQHGKGPLTRFIFGLTTFFPELLEPIAHGGSNGRTFTGYIRRTILVASSKMELIFVSLLNFLISTADYNTFAEVPTDDIRLNGPRVKWVQVLRLECVAKYHTNIKYKTSRNMRLMFVTFHT